MSNNILIPPELVRKTASDLAENMLAVFGNRDEEVKSVKVLEMFPIVMVEIECESGNIYKMKCYGDDWETYCEECEEWHEVYCVDHHPRLESR